MARTRFELNKRGLDELAKGSQKHMVKVARSAARAGNDHVPNMTTNESIDGEGEHDIFGVLGPLWGYEGDEGTARLVNRSSFWALMEYGGGNVPARHPIEEGLSAVGLRLE